MHLRVGIAGPGRRRNGVGEHVARFLAQLGAPPAAAAASDWDRSRFHAERLRTLYDIRSKPCGSIREMLDRENLDALAICTPADGHEEQLRWALDRGVHVFCEKPLVWRRSEESSETAGALVKDFYTKGLVLHCNTQWTYTLPDFERLHGPIDRRAAEEFEMHLSPAMEDTQSMIREAAPHANSLLLALGAVGKPWNLEVAESQGTGVPKQWEARFMIRGEGGQAIRARYTFAHHPEQPRPAAYAINGKEARREIELPEYRQYFRGADRRIAIGDPLKTSVASFLDKVLRCRSGGEPPLELAAAENVRLLDFLSRYHSPEEERSGDCLHLRHYE